MQGGARKNGKAEEVPSYVTTRVAVHGNCQVVPRVHAYRNTAVHLVIKVFKFGQRQKSQGNYTVTSDQSFVHSE